MQKFTYHDGNCTCLSQPSSEYLFFLNPVAQLDLLAQSNQIKQWAKRHKVASLDSAKADSPNPLFHKQDVFIFVGALTDPTAWSTISFSSSAVSLSKFSRSRSSLRRSSSSRTLCFSITLLVGSSAALPDWRQRRRVQCMHFVADHFYVALFSTLQQTQWLKAKETGSMHAFCCRSLLCSSILHASADSMRSCCMWLWMSDQFL